MMDKTAQEEPETSWSENTTPASDDLGDIEEDIEEIERDPPLQRRRSGEIGKSPQYMRSPIRRRPREDLCHAVGVTCSQQSYTFSILGSRGSMDGSVASSSSGVTIVTSATSSCTDPWNSPGFVEVDDAWSREDEDWLMVPKEEPSEDNINMADVKETPQANKEAKSTPTIPGKRPRGRPRKHPVVSAEDKAKIAKARSKTGCITCRKRKKKCDERKPGCLNCEKNAVTCEGYPQKTIWKSGKERAEEALQRRASISSIIMAPKLAHPINGIETPGDEIFLDHYMNVLSFKFTVEGEPMENIFRSTLFKMAMEYPPLMHSVLALSGKHIDFGSPASLHLLREHPEVDIPSLEERLQYHNALALSELREGLDRQREEDQLIPATLGQMICLVLETLADPEPTGLHRLHLNYYKDLIKEKPLGDSDFLRFAKEFFGYHLGLDELIFLPEADPVTGCLPLSTEWELPEAFVQPEVVHLLGVSDGLFYYMSKITKLRNKIREMMRNGVQPPFDYSIFDPAGKIHTGLMNWKAAWPPGDPRDLAGILYRQMLHVYLRRTVHPPNPTTWKIDERLIQEVDEGIAMLEKFGPSERNQTLILAPAFLLGCAAFKESQRGPIRKAIGTVKSYMNCKNSDSALLVVEEVWRLMDLKDPRSWDWQQIAKGMGMDFLAT